MRRCRSVVVLGSVVGVLMLLLIGVTDDQNQAMIYQTEQQATDQDLPQDSLNAHVQLLHRAVQQLKYAEEAAGIHKRREMAQRKHREVQKQAERNRATDSLNSIKKRVKDLIVKHRNIIKGGNKGNGTDNVAADDEEGDEETDEEEAADDVNNDKADDNNGDVGDDNKDVTKVDDGAENEEEAEEEGVDEIKQFEQMENHVQQKLVILTYMRSGSSFTGDLFQNHEMTFYVYEPLWRLQKMYSEGKPLSYLDRESIDVQGDVLDSQSESSNTLRAMLGCDFVDVDIDTLMQGHMITSKDTKPFRYCRGRSPDSDKLRRCLKLLYEPCLQAKVTTVKVIRFTMEQAAQLLEADPEVKVVHLIRDPRGMFYSQRRVGDLKWADFARESKRRCQRIHKDILKSIELSARFPKRILTVRYEDIAENPIESAEEMYKFVGLQMTESGRSYIHNITNGLADTCPICTVRKNSTSTAYKWREKVSFESIQTIDRGCGGVYDMMGFRPYYDKDDVHTFLPKLDDFSDKLYKISSIR